MIEEIVIQHKEEKYAPCEQPLLSLSLIGDEIYVSVVKTDDFNDGTEQGRTYTDIAHVSVDVLELMRCVALLGESYNDKVSRLDKQTQPPPPDF